MRKSLYKTKYAKKRGDEKLTDYTKAVLYAYPMIKDLESACEEHIKNKAILSYKYLAPCEGLVEYLTEEIAKKEKLMWLENILNGAVDKLNDTEKLLLEIRYFGKKKGKGNVVENSESWSESTYFRMQKRLEKRIENLLKREGLTQQVFDEWFAPMQAFQYVHACMQRKKEDFNQAEKRWFT